MKWIAIVCTVIIASLFTSCITIPATPDPVLGEYTLHAPSFPEPVHLDWNVKNGTFYVSRDEALELANWYSRLDTYRDMLDLFYSRIESVINTSDDVSIEIRRE